MHGQLAPSHALARLASRQGGVVSHAQLVELGVSADAVTHRALICQLHPLHRGVYAVGHEAVGADGRRWAAVLALGEDAFLSHASAADAQRIRASSSPLVHVSVRGRAGRARRAGIRVHRPRSLPDDEVTTLRGLPITTVARTIIDLAGTGLKPRELENVLNLAELEAHLDFSQLHELLARYPRRPGTRSLKAQLDTYRGPVDTRSKLERLVYELCDAHGLPRPVENCSTEGRVRDFYWPHRRLVVEADSFRWHRTPSALNEDRERDVELTLAGYTVLRFTWEQVTRRPQYVIRALRQALGAS